MSAPRGVVLDMEGVLHVDWEPIDGSAAAVNSSRCVSTGSAAIIPFGTC